MADETKKVRTMDDLRELITELHVEKEMDDAAIARELEKRGVQPTGWSRWRVECLRIAFASRRPGGRPPSRAKKVWREEVEPRLAGFSDSHRAAFFHEEVVPLAKSEQHTKAALHRTHGRGIARKDMTDQDWSDLAECCRSTETC